MTTVTENEQVTEEYKEHKKKELLEAIAAWKPSMAEQELFNDEDYWEQSAEEAVKKLDKKLGWNNGGNDDDGSGKGSNGNGNGNGNGKSRKQKEGPKPFPIYKFTSKEFGLVEEILIAGQSRFLCIDPKTGEPKILNSLSLDEMGIVLTPHAVRSLNPNQSLIYPYAYDSLNEIKELLVLVQKLSISDIYQMVEYVWRNVVVAKDNELITLLTNYTIFSYFQDLFETLHYIVLSGPPGWGKGAILVAFKMLGYRVVLAGDMSGANLLDLLGTIERCQLSLAEDELDDLDKDPDKQRIYKLGYEDTATVPRTVDAGSSNRDLRCYSPYGCKMFAGEKPPDSKYLGGFNDRSFRAEARKGKPNFLIKKIKKQMERPINKQSPAYRNIIARIHFFHKTLLLYRLLHHPDTIDEISLNISGRPLELCGPSIQLYQTFANQRNEPKDKGVRDKVMNALGYFLRKKGALDKKSLEAVLYEVLVEIFNRIDAKGEGYDENQCKSERRLDLQTGAFKNVYVVSYDEICNRFMKEVDGVQVSGRTFECAEFNKLTHDVLLDRCRNVFSATNGTIGRDKGRKKALEFDRDTVKEAGDSFDIVSEIKILEHEEVVKVNSEDEQLWKKIVEQNPRSLGTSLLTHTSENEGFGLSMVTNEHVSLAMGTSCPFSNDIGSNDQKQNSQSNSDVEERENHEENTENITNKDQSNNDTHNHISSDWGLTGDPTEQKLAPKSPLSTTGDQEDQGPPCDLSNEETAKRLMDEVERLKSTNKK